MVDLTFKLPFGFSFKIIIEGVKSGHDFVLKR